MDSPSQTSPPPNRPPGNRLADFFMFRWMITPSLIVVVYLLGVILITLAPLYLFAAPEGAAGPNLLAFIISYVPIWIIAQLYWRVILEVLIVLFRIYESVRSIDRKTRDG